MKYTNKILALILCATLLFTGCKKETGKKESDPQQIQSYSDAAAAVRSAQNLNYSITQRKTTTVGDQTIEEIRSQTINLRDFKTKKMAVSATEQITVGDNTVELKQSYYDGVGYLEIGNRHFCSPTGADNFMSQFAPAILLNQDRYRNVETIVNNGITVYHFSECTTAEEWAIPATATLKQAHGDATTDKNGRLIATTYHITYSDGPASVKTETTVTLSYPESVDIATPDKSKYTELKSLSAPKLLETAYLYLNNLQKITTTANSTMTSDAFSIRRTQSTQATVAWSEPFAANINTLVTQQDSGKNDATVIQQSIVFENGMYSSTIDGITETDNTMTQEIMQTNTRNLILGNIPTADQLCAASEESMDGYTIVTLQVGNEISDLICQQVSSSLYGDPHFLSSISESVNKSQPEFYFTINRQTGFPTACGYSFETTHTIDGADYKITSFADQSFLIDTALTAPASDSIDPPFYSVTDENGKTLWILATTQYGDPRSASLPTQVYTALTQAETIILEYPNKPSQNIVQSKNDISDELYAQAAPYLLISGISHSEAARDAVELNNNIRDHFIRNGYRLNQVNSIHNSIYQYAVPSGKYIDILFPDNDPLQFYRMLSSDAQQLLLQNTIQNISALEQNAYLLSEALYHGNDAELIEFLRFDALTDDTELLDELTETLYVTPSETIAQLLATYLEDGKNAFAVIDASYLTFNDNVLDNLREMGYTVTRN